MQRSTAALAFALAASVALGCPSVIRDPHVEPPPPGCEPGATSCHGGAPWRCGPGGVWSRANRVCSRLDVGDAAPAVCCPAPSPLRPGRAGHACVPAALCDDGGAP